MADETRDELQGNEDQDNEAAETPDAGGSDPGLGAVAKGAAAGAAAGAAVGAAAGVARAKMGSNEDEDSGDEPEDEQEG